MKELVYDYRSPWLWANVKNRIEFIVIIIIINVIAVASWRMKQVAIDITLDAIVEAPQHFQMCRCRMLIGRLT
jgi:hypothetical protein